MTKLNRNRIIKYLIILSALPLWIYWDISQASGNAFNYNSCYPALQSKASEASGTKVAIVTSDDPALANPSARNINLSYQTVEQMVWRAVSLAGGFPDIKSGMTVLIKPNLVESQQPSGSGNDTDVRVVEAVARIVDEIDHGKIKILAGDGSPRPYTTFERSASTGKSAWNELYGDPDSTKDAGYQKLLLRMKSSGIDFRLVNLNGNSDTNPWAELKEVIIPEGAAQAQPQKGKYFISQDLLNADVYITIPVMKIHDPGITCALKNQIGVAPSSMYGFSKTAGVPQDNYNHRLLHTTEAPYNWTDKEIVDLCSIAFARKKYVVVDALMCLEVQKTIRPDKSNQVRMNTIVAGGDPVAVDHVCSKLMGLNPDDIEHITLAERTGLGTNNPEKITVAGADISAVMKRFKKNTSVPDQIFGQSNREWIISSLFPVNNISDPINHEFIVQEALLSPLPGKEGFSQSTYFINDKINLKDYYESAHITPDNAVCYAFTYLSSPQDQEAELWTGSDEAMKIYLNGEAVYNFSGTRYFGNSVIWIDPVTKIKLKKGLNRLLVKIYQNAPYSSFDFSLNICEGETNSYYRGGRMPGLKFFTDPAALTAAAKNNTSRQPAGFFLENCYPNPFNSSISISFKTGVDENVTLAVYNMLGEKIKTLFKGRAKPTETAKTLWDGTDDNNKYSPSGAYIVVMSGNKNKSAAKKIMLLK